VWEALCFGAGKIASYAGGDYELSAAIRWIGVL
jgi:hypothetical protein